jgi:hypothetical protein
MPTARSGSIAYLANGDKTFPKERVEIFCGGRVAVLDDFRTLELVFNGHKKHYRSAFRRIKGIRHPGAPSWMLFKMGGLHPSLTHSSWGSAGQPFWQAKLQPKPPAFQSIEHEQDQATAKSDKDTLSIGMGIVYAVCAVSNWIAQRIFQSTHPRTASFGDAEATFKIGQIYLAVCSSTRFEGSAGDRSTVRSVKQMPCWMEMSFYSTN